MTLDFKTPSGASDFVLGGSTKGMEQKDLFSLLKIITETFTSLQVA